MGSRDVPAPPKGSTDPASPGKPVAMGISTRVSKSRLSAVNCIAERDPRGYDPPASRGVLRLAASRGQRRPPRATPRTSAAATAPLVSLASER